MHEHSCDSRKETGYQITGAYIFLYINTCQLNGCLVGTAGNDDSSVGSVVLDECHDHDDDGASDDDRVAIFLAGHCGYCCHIRTSDRSTVGYDRAKSLPMESVASVVQDPCMPP